MSAKIKMYETNVRISYLLHRPIPLLIQEFDRLVTNPRCLLLHLHIIWKCFCSENRSSWNSTWLLYHSLQIAFLASRVSIRAIIQMKALKSPLLILTLSPKTLMILFWINHSISQKRLLQKLPEAFFIIPPHYNFQVFLTPYSVLLYSLDGVGSVLQLKRGGDLLTS